eukprot:GILI01039483.1.p1 GENE.GILI01039483.1~~GILI01039483.1.p1  ORF type:complete len:287 (-),score=48.95 GILI01039483.1:58-918(-)
MMAAAKGLPIMRVVHASPSVQASQGTKNTSSGGTAATTSTPRAPQQEGSSTPATTIDHSTFSADHSDVKLPKLTSIPKGIPTGSPLARDRATTSSSPNKDIVNIHTSTSDSSGILAVICGTRKAPIVHAEDQSSSEVDSTLLAYPSASVYMKAMGLGGGSSGVGQNEGSVFNVISDASYSATVGSIPSFNNSVHVYSGDGHNHHNRISRVTASVVGNDNRSKNNNASSIVSGELLSFDKYPIEHEADDVRQAEPDNVLSASQVPPPGPSGDCFSSMVVPKPPSSPK